MKRTRPPGRPRLPVPKDHQFNFRLSEAEYELIVEAAGGYPPTTWARVELLKLARSIVGTKPKRRR